MLSLLVTHNSWKYLTSYFNFDGNTRILTDYGQKSTQTSGVDHTDHFWHHPSASPAVIVWKMVGQHLFLNIIPNNFTGGTGPKVWCDRDMSVGDLDSHFLWSSTFSNPRYFVPSQAYSSFLDYFSISSDGMFSNEYSKQLRVCGIFANSSIPIWDEGL